MGTIPWLVVLFGVSCGFVVGYLLGTLRGQRHGRSDGVELGRLEGYREGHEKALEMLQVKEIPLSRRASVFPFSRKREGVRYELWVRGVPTSFATERWSSDAIEVDEAAMRTLIEAGVPALADGARKALADRKTETS